ncbi:AraC family transcriptional regulator [Luteibacter sp. OK325]|uniref:cupin domain-containing protein n=1 Tax=Luteibacter sp. OK325 TaxID=2135670 RepID=UPI001E53E83E|nr:AraC family transcriptional regulator [Luteibacter sp. OK325]
MAWLLAGGGWDGRILCFRPDIDEPRYVLYAAQKDHEVSMSHDIDWLSRFLATVSVTGRLEIRCLYGAPWNITYIDSPPGEMPYHLVIRGTAVLEPPPGGKPTTLAAGDILLMVQGGAHVLRDVSGLPPGPVHEREALNVLLSENEGEGEPLEMLCGRFVIAPPHDRWLRHYLPPTLVIRARKSGSHDELPAANRLSRLVSLMREESADEGLGGYALLNSLSSALFALALRASSEADAPPAGLLSLAAHPRLAPAISAMFSDPARAWTLPELAALTHMSRATFMRRFQEGLGRSASEFLQDIRMSLAANDLKNPGRATEVVAEAVGYQSVSAFRRVFTERIGMTPGAWRRQFTAGAISTRSDE